MPKVIAIGGSHGGVSVLQKIAAGLPSDFPTAVLIVLHIGAEPSLLPSILSSVGPLPAHHVKEREQIGRASCRERV